MVRDALAALAKMRAEEGVALAADLAHNGRQISELLDAITGALGVPLWYVLREVSERMAELDGTVVADTVPDDLMPVALIS